MRATSLNPIIVGMKHDAGGKTRQNAMRKFLALVLSLGLVWGPLSPAALAQVITRGAAPAVAPVPAGIGASATSLSHSVTFSPTAASPLAMPALPGSIGLTPAVPTAGQATVSAAKAYAPAVAAVTPAAPASLAAVERHPALGLIADLQKAGGDALLSQLDAAKSPADFEAVAMALKSSRCSGWPDIGP